MAKVAWTSRVGSLLSVPMAVVLVILFFVPWLDVTCSNMKVASATGLQLSLGKITREENPGGMKGAVKPDEPKAEKKDEKDPAARPWFLLCLLLPAMLMAVGVFGSLGRLSGAVAGLAIVGLAIVGLIMACLATGVDYGKEMMNDQPAKVKNTDGTDADGMGQAMGQAMGKMMAEKSPIQTQATGALVTTIVFYSLLIAIGALNLVLPTALRALAKATAPPPAAPTA